MLKSNKTLAILIILGWLVYFSRGCRSDFKGNEIVLFWLGFIPNFGLSFALPLVYVSNRINSKKPVLYFNWACLMTFLIMITNEIVDKFQPKKVFDWLDIIASLVGVLSAFIIYHRYLKRNL